MLIAGQTTIQYGYDNAIVTHHIVQGFSTGGPWDHDPLVVHRNFSTAF